MMLDRAAHEQLFPAQVWWQTYQCTAELRETGTVPSYSKFCKPQLLWSISIALLYITSKNSRECDLLLPNMQSLCTYEPPELMPLQVACAYGCRAGSWWPGMALSVHHKPECTLPGTCWSAQSYDARTVQINILLLILINFSTTVGKIVPTMLFSLYQS